MKFPKFLFSYKLYEIHSVLCGVKKAENDVNNVNNELSIARELINNSIYL